MDNVREKLVKLLNRVQDNGHKTTHEAHSVNVYVKSNEDIADHLIANGVTVGGVAELISSSKIGLDWYTRIPIYYCSHCGWYIESRSKPPERPRDLVFCPKCGFMFLPQKEVDDVSS